MYEGVDSEPLKYHGGSAAQSSIIYVFDIIIGAEHSGEQAEFITAMRDYMPRKHRDFLIKLQAMPSIRDYCNKSADKEVIGAFNGLVDALVSFRRRHHGLIQTYIIQHIAQHSVEGVRGTGGAKLVKFLKSVIEDTEALKIKENYK